MTFSPSPSLVKIWRAWSIDDANDEFVITVVTLYTRACFCSLWEIYRKNAPQKVKRDEILTACALFVICTRVTTLHSFHMINEVVFSWLEECYFSMHINIGVRAQTSAYCKYCTDNFFVLEFSRTTHESMTKWVTKTTSPYYFYTIWYRPVMRIKKNINYGITNWSDTKFSKLT